MIAYNINKTTCTIVIDSEIFTMNTDDVRFQTLIGILGGSETDDEKTEKINDLFEKNSIFEEAYNDDDFEVDEEGNLTYNSVVIEGELAVTLKALLELKFVDLDRYKRFIDNLMENPSATSIKELYSFMSYDQLPITEDGMLLAYKGVSDDYYSIHGNSKTVVKQGVLNDNHCIRNQVGDVIEVARNQVDDDRSVGCSFGLHAGSYDYARSFGCRTIVVKIHPKDVVSVPFDCNCQKMRVCKYECVEEIEKKLSTVCPSDEEPLKEQKDVLVSSFMSEISVNGLKDEICSIVSNHPHISVSTLHKLLLRNGLIKGDVTSLHILDLIMQELNFQLFNLETGNFDIITLVNLDDGVYVYDDDEDEGEYWEY